MKYLKIVSLLFFVVAFSAVAFAQDQKLIKRTTYKTDRLEFGVGGTLTLVGAPEGSVRVEGWANREIEISAEIGIEAPTEADLEILSKVSGFVLEETIGRTAIVTVGPHDRKAIKRLNKKFPKHLFDMPFRVDYVIKVPRYTDIDINGGKGDLSVSGIDGNILINFLEANAKIDLVGGSISATFGKGSVDLTIPKQSWRGRFADVQIATGTMNLFLPVGLNAQFDASILRTGRIENGFEGFKPRIRNGEFTERSIAAKSGTGTIPLKFTVGDGTMKISEIGRGS